MPGAGNGPAWRTASWRGLRQWGRRDRRGGPTDRRSEHGSTEREQGEGGTGGPTESRRDRPDVGRRIRLAFLAPDVVAAIVAGEQPKTLTIGALLRDQDIPPAWVEQRRLFGFPDPRDANR